MAKGIAKSGGFKQAMGKGWCKFGFGKCFVAGTLIHTPDGPRPIEEIRVGDKVWAHDLVTGRDELQLVVDTFVRTTTELFHLTINDQQVSTTAEHPFMVQGRGWVDAAFLKTGDLLVTPEGTTVQVEAIETEQRTETDAETVYNFHVETHSNYYVHAGDAPVLVHNANHVRNQALPKGDNPWIKYQKHVTGRNHEEVWRHNGRNHQVDGGPRPFTAEAKWTGKNDAAWNRSPYNPSHAHYDEAKNLDQADRLLALNDELGEKGVRYAVSNEAGANHLRDLYTREFPDHMADGRLASGMYQEMGCRHDEKAKLLEDAARAAEMLAPLTSESATGSTKRSSWPVAARPDSGRAFGSRVILPGNSSLSWVVVKQTCSK